MYKKYTKIHIDLYKINPYMYISLYSMNIFVKYHGDFTQDPLCL